MNKFVTMLAILMAGFIFVSCTGTNGVDMTTSSESAVETASTATTGDESLQVALVMAGPINDQGWNASAYEGLTIIEETLGAEVSYTESVAAADFEEVYRGYADLGYDIIFGHGFQFGDIATAVAPDYPETFFLVTGSNISQEPNVAGLENRNEQQGFLAGVVAAQHSQTGTVGAVGGAEIPSFIKYIEGFEQGAKYVNPDITVLTNYTGDSFDPATAKQLATSMIAEGADVLTHNANAAGLGVFEAVEEAGEGVWMIGAVSDQYEVLPGQTITSALSNLRDTMVEAAGMYVNGEMEAEGHSFGIAEGVVGLADFRDFPVSEEQQAQLDEITGMLENDEIEVVLPS